jgi:RimJ/RimL family protein N-acetyltransferase
MEAPTITKTTGRKATVEQARYVFEAQAFLRDAYGGPISLGSSFDYTFAECDGQFVGCIVSYEDRDPERGTWILTAYVNPDCRQQGILRTMLDSIDGNKSLGTCAENMEMRTAMDRLGWRFHSLEYRSL